MLITESNWMSLIQTGDINGFFVAEEIERRLFFSDIDWPDILREFFNTLHDYAKAQFFGNLTSDQRKYLSSEDQTRVNEIIGDFFTEYTDLLES